MEKNKMPDNIRVIDLNAKNLEELFDKVLFKHFNKLADSKNTNPIQQNAPQYVSRKEAADLLKITLPTLNVYTKSGKLTAYKIGRRVLYDSIEIAKALSEQPKYLRK